MSEIRPGKASFLAENMIPDTDDGITASSQASGATSRPQKEGAGAANALLGGTYSGTNNLDYYIEIESTGEIGAATFRWSDDGGASFDATGVATSTAAVALNNGVTVRWTQGAGNDVVDGDTWRFKGYLPYHRRNLLDRERDTEWRSSSVASQTLTFNLGSALEPSVLVLLDHNLTASASIVLQCANNSGFAPITTQWVVPWQSGSLLYFLGAPLQTRQYWRLLLSNPGNGDGYLRASEIFLGAYTRLDRTFDLGDFRGKVRAGQRAQTLSGKFYGAANSVNRVFDLTWVRLSQTDRDQLIAVFDALNDLDNRRVRPVFFSPMSTDLTQIALCEWEGQVVAGSETDAPEKYSVPVRLIEIPRTLALSS